MVRRSRSLVAVALLVLATASAGNGLAAWPADPSIHLPICTAPGGQGPPLAVSDGRSGAIIAWLDGREPGKALLYAQRVNHRGHLLWARDGVPVCTDPSSKTGVVMVADGRGGAILAWIDARHEYADVYAQRLSPGGEMLWPPEGRAVCSAPLNQQDVQLAADGVGGAFVAWSDNRFGGDAIRVFVQRVRRDGALLWGENGVGVTNRYGEQLTPRVVAEGDGGAIVAWVGLVPSSGSDLFAQRLDVAGRPLWSNGVLVNPPSGNVSSFDCVADGAGGLIAVFDDDRNELLDIDAQRLDANGARLWGPAPPRVCEAPQHQQGPHAVSDGAGGAFVTWDLDSRGEARFAQHLGSDGDPLWTPGGIRFTDHERPIGVVQDADPIGALVLAWYDPVTRDLFTQRLSEAGARLWGANGTLTSSSLGQEYPSAIVADADGGAIVAWSHERAGESHVYAQRVPFGPPRRGRSVVAEEASPRLELRGATPHPARGGVLRLSLAMAAEGAATIEVFDPSGRRVAIRECAPQPEATVELRTESWPAGVYLVRLRQGAHSATGRVVVAP